MVHSAPNLRPVAIDLFAGAGGLSLGLEQAGFDVAAAIDIDPIHCATHLFNFPACKVICGSLATINGQDIRSAANLGRRRIDLVAGGPPCQGFSLMGKRSFEDPRNALVKHFMRIVLELDARYFVFENVKGLTVGAHSQFLRELIEEFQSIGYLIAIPWQVLNASSYGVPQSRERLFLLGAKRGEKLPGYPAPLTRPPGVEEDFLLPSCPTVEEALGDIPDAELCTELSKRDSAMVRFGPPSRYAARLRGEEDDPADFSFLRPHTPGLLTSSLRAVHTAESRRRFHSAVPGETEPISRFFKLDAGGICNTLRAGTASDRGAFTSPRPIHYRFDRCITVREMARLHSYPDWFRFHCTKWHGGRQIGNSVPPMLGRSVASSVMQAISGTPVKPSDIQPLGDVGLLSMNMAQAAAFFDVPRDVIPQRNRPAKGCAVTSGA